MPCSTFGHKGLTGLCIAQVKLTVSGGDPDVALGIAEKGVGATNVPAVNIPRLPGFIAQADFNNTARQRHQQVLAGQLQRGGYGIVRAGTGQRHFGKVAVVIMIEPVRG